MALFVERSDDGLAHAAIEAGVSIGVFVRIPDNSQETTNTTTTVTIRILDFVKTRPRYSPWGGPIKFDLLVLTTRTERAIFTHSLDLVLFQLYISQILNICVPIRHTCLRFHTYVEVCCLRSVKRFS